MMSLVGLVLVYRAEYELPNTSCRIRDIKKMFDPTTDLFDSEGFYRRPD